MLNKKIKKILILTLVVLTICFVTGCKKNEALVYFLNFKPEAATIYEEIAKKYEEEKGVKVKVVTAASGTYEETLSGEVLKSSQPTIFQVNGPVGFSNWKDYCYNLRGTKLYEILLDKSLAITDGDGVYGIPFAIEGYGLVYNKDVFTEYFAQDSKNTTLTSLDEVTSFNQFKDIVADLDKYIKGTKQATNAPTIDKLQGVFASTSLENGSQWPFQTHLANIPFYYEFLDVNNTNATLGGLAIKTGELKFTYNKEYKNIFDLYLDYGVKEKTTLGAVNTNYATSEFATGKAAFLQQGNWIYNDILKVTESNVITKDNIGMMPIFIGHEGEDKLTIPVGTENYFCVNKKVSEEKIKESINFLVWLFTSTEGKDYVTNKLGFIAPFSSFTEAEKPSDPLAKEVLRIMAIEGKTAIPWSFAAFPSEAFKNEFGSALLLYAQGQKTWDEVVEAVKKAWVVTST